MVGSATTPRTNLTVVLRILVWALPQQYRVLARSASRVHIDLSAGGIWQLTSDGSTHWSLEEGGAEDPDALAHFSDDAGWRWLTGGAVPREGVQLQGPPELCQPLLDVRSIII